MTPRPMLTIAQVMERLQVCYDTAWRLIRDGELRAAKIGHSWRVDADDLEAFLDARKRGALARLRDEASLVRERVNGGGVLDADLLLPPVDNPFLRAH